MSQEKHIIEVEKAWAFKETPQQLPDELILKTTLSWGAELQENKGYDDLDWQPMIVQSPAILGGAPVIFIPNTDIAIPTSLIEGLAIQLGDGKGFHYAGLCRELHVRPEQVMAVLAYAEWDREIDGPIVP